MATADPIAAWRATLDDLAALGRAERGANEQTTRRNANVSEARTSSRADGTSVRPKRRKVTPT